MHSDDRLGLSPGHTRRGSEPGISGSGGSDGLPGRCSPRGLETAPDMHLCDLGPGIFLILRVGVDAGHRPVQRLWV